MHNALHARDLRSFDRAILNIKKESDFSRNPLMYNIILVPFNANYARTTVDKYSNYKLLKMKNRSKFSTAILLKIFSIGRFYYELISTTI